MPPVNLNHLLGVGVRNVDIDRAMYELRRVDKDLFNEMRRDFRREIRPAAKRLQQNIPRGGSPLSGMSRAPSKARTLKSVEARSPYVWKLPSTKIDIGTRRRRGPDTQSVVRLRFIDRRPYSAFSILETARNANSVRGQNMIAGITSKYPNRGKGRWVIEQFYNRRPEMLRIAGRVVSKYSTKLNRKLRRRGVL